LVLAIAPAFARISTAATNQVLTNVAAILSLTHEQATQDIRISITGVVTLAEPTWGGLFFVQDSTGGVFVNNQNPRPAVGDVVQVTGVSHAGGFAPDIMSPIWKKLGTAPLPEAKLVSVERLMSGAEDGNRVEVSGVVRFARKEGGLLLLELAAGGYRFRAHPRASTNLVASSLIGATVRVRGTAAASFNRELRQIIGVNLYMPQESDLIIEHWYFIDHDLDAALSDAYINTVPPTSPGAWDNGANLKLFGFGGLGMDDYNWRSQWQN